MKDFLINSLLMNMSLFWLLQISNGIGVISGLVQLLLYAFFWCKGRNKKEAEDHVPKPAVAAVWSDNCTSVFFYINKFGYYTKILLVLYWNL